MKIRPHESLGMSFRELGAFLATYAMLKERVIAYSERMRAEPHTHSFNMSVGGDIKECGTVGCIGGTMAFIMGVDPEKYVQGAKGHLRDLFFPPYEYDYQKIPKNKAMKAMENFAATGNPKWAKVLGRNFLEKKE